MARVMLLIVSLFRWQLVRIGRHYSHRVVCVYYVDEAKILDLSKSRCIVFDNTRVFDGSWLAQGASELVSEREPNHRDSNIIDRS